MQQQLSWDFGYSNNLFSKEIGSSKFFEAIERELPPVFTRQQAAKTIGGIISAKSFSNLDALRQGPSVKVRIKGKIGYEKESFMQWLKARMCAW
ncbi:MAG: hypothetical protein LBT59_21280 [Clostridiales bacterium]|jgi:hypothetical protein|nr:hypothetical protein [Clostridiales bacterium]